MFLLFSWWKMYTITSVNTPATSPWHWHRGSSLVMRMNIESSYHSFCTVQFQLIWLEPRPKVSLKTGTAWFLLKSRSTLVIHDKVFQSKSLDLQVTFTDWIQTWPFSPHKEDSISFNRRVVYHFCESEMIGQKCDHVATIVWK